VVQRIAGSIGIGLLAALYASVARAGGGDDPAAALHVTGTVVTCVAAAGIGAALALPPARNTDPRRL
jgi:hypothetical protein